MKTVEQFTSQFSSALARVVARTANNAQITVSLDLSWNLTLTPVLNQDYDPKSAGVIWDSRFDEALPMLRQLAAKTSVRAACDAYVDIQILHILWQAQILAQHIKAPAIKAATLGTLARVEGALQAQAARQVF